MELSRNWWYNCSDSVPKGNTFLIFLSCVTRYCVFFVQMLRIMQPCRKNNTYNIFLTNPFFNEKEGDIERDGDRETEGERENRSLFIVTRHPDQSRVMRPPNGRCVYCNSGTRRKKSKSCCGSEIFCLWYLYTTSLLFFFRSPFLWLKSLLATKSFLY